MEQLKNPSLEPCLRGLEFLSLGRRHGLETPSDRNNVKVYVVLGYQPL